MEWACQTDGAENEWTMNEVMSEMNLVLWERLKFDKKERELAFLSMSRERRTQEQEGALRGLPLRRALSSLVFPSSGN